MGLLLFVGVIVLIVLFFSRSGSSKKVSLQEVELKLSARNNEWVQFILGYRKVVKTKAEKSLINRMLADIRQQNLSTLAVPIETTESESELEQPELVAKQTPAVVAQEISNMTATAAVVAAPQQAAVPERKPIDNASLLLYFGAFLFVASVGLFIAFSGAEGDIKTLAVFAVMAIMYGGGVWLFKHMPKLQQAGLAFAGIGMTIAPLVGAAAYYYMFDQTNGPVIWLITSVVCLAMYTHALFALRHQFIPYILLFTFLSLFESGVSIIHVPIYYFGWGMAFVSILFALLSQIKIILPELQKPSKESAQVFLPVAVFVSLILVPQHGVGQLGVSLLFAAVFYGLQALSTQGEERQTNAIVGHVAGLLSAAALSYTFHHDWRDMALAFIAINVLQIGIVGLMKPTSGLQRNFASILILSTLCGVGMTFSSPALMLAAIGLVMAAGWLTWLRQYRSDAYVIASAGLMALPIAFGQFYSDPRVAPLAQSVLLYAALVAMLGIYCTYKIKRSKDTDWVEVGRTMFVTSAAVVIAASFFASPVVCLAITAAVVALFVFLAEYEKNEEWPVVISIAIATPMARVVQDSEVLIIANLIALAVNILLALRYRKEFIRWVGAILWFVLPVSLGTGALGHWTVLTYAWAYFLVMLGLVLSRAIARGVVYLSQKAPMASFTKSASISYVVGYISAGAASITLSLFSPDSRLHTSLIVAGIAVVTYLLSAVIEKRSDITTFLPLLFQLFLWSVLRPTAAAESLNFYLICSTLLAIGCYALGMLQVAEQEWDKKQIGLREGGIIAIFVTPAAAFFVPTTVLMPIGLILAGLLVYFHLRQSSQASREAAGVVVTAGIMWILWFAGVRETQAYTHVLAAMFAVYALWRASRDEQTQCDQYLIAMLLTTTVPLATQAMSGAGGGLYGWWLLIEQIGFMLLGMIIRKRFVIFWGLYVAVGSVLYQLRDLSWAALTVLALFVIGIAVYQLQKHNDKN